MKKTKVLFSLSAYLQNKATEKAVKLLYRETKHKAKAEKLNAPNVNVEKN